MDDLPRHERHSRDCKKSLFMKSSHDKPEDAASTQAQLAGGRTVLSPATLGQGLRKGMEGVPKKKERKRPGKIGSAAYKQARAHSSHTVDSEEVPSKVRPCSMSRESRCYRQNRWRHYQGIS